MGVINEMKAEAVPGPFEVGEIVKVKGTYFKVVLIDLFAAKIALKVATNEELREAGLVS